MGRIALMLHFRGRDREAHDWADRAEKAAMAQSDEESLLMASWVRALSLAARGRSAAAWSVLDSIARIGRGEETFWHARVPNTYGAILADLGLYARALERDAESLETARRYTARPLQEVAVQTALNLATDHLGLGHVGEARAGVESVRRQIADVEYARFRWLARMHFLDSQVAVAEGDPARARGAADSCLTMAAEYGLPKYEARGRLATAMAFAAEGHPAAARKHARSAARMADRSELPALAWRAWRTAFEASGSADDRRGAEAAVEALAAGLEEPMRSDFLRAAPCAR
jgi:tetratricopeptide (TPR) repeat protein